MDAVARALAIYFLLLVILRLAGRRTLAQMTAFDFVLLLIISEATQQALLGDDFSVTNAAIVVLTLVGTDIALSVILPRLPWLERVVSGVPMIIVEHGRPLEGRMRWARVSTDEVLEAARNRHGLERLDQIKFAVLEVSGGISIIPTDPPVRDGAPDRA